MSKPPFVNIFDISGVLLVLCLLVGFCTLIGALPIKALGFIVLVTVAALFLTSRGRTG